MCLSAKQPTYTIQEEIGHLVRSLFPDDSKLFDKAMQRFEGHEDELVATLRVMKMRAESLRQRGQKPNPSYKKVTFMRMPDQAPTSTDEETSAEEEIRTDEEDDDDEEWI